MLSRIPSLDGIRAMAILLVVIGHHLDAQGILTGLPTLGVRVFFVLSGYLITTIVWRQMEGGEFSFRRFYWRRAAKLLPVLYLYVGVLMAFAAALKIEGVWDEFARALTFTTGHYRLAENGNTNHTWSLSVEEFFYLTWVPVLVLASIRVRRVWSVGLLILCPLTRYLNDALSHQEWQLQVFHIPVSYIPIFDSLDFMAMGCILALGETGWRPLTDRLSGAWHKCVLAFAFFALFTSAMVLYSRNPIAILCGPALQGLASCLLIALLTNPQTHLTYRIMNWLPVVLIGQASYSIYVVQQAFFWGFGPNSVAEWQTSPGCIPLSIIAGILVYRLIEAPIINKARSVENLSKYLAVHGSVRVSQPKAAEGDHDAA